MKRRMETQLQLRGERDGGGRPVAAHVQAAVSKGRGVQAKMEGAGSEVRSSPAHLTLGRRIAAGSREPQFQGTRAQLDRNPAMVAQRQAQSVVQMGGLSTRFRIWNHRTDMTNGEFLAAVRQWVPNYVHAYLDFGDFTGRPSVTLQTTTGQSIATVRGWIDNALGAGQYTLTRGPG